MPPATNNHHARATARRFWSLNQYDRSDLLNLCALLNPAKTPTGQPTRSLTNHLSQSLAKLQILGGLNILNGELKAMAKAHAAAKRKAKSKTYRPSRKSPQPF